MQESGSHRWQRVPPTESKGRVHTSAITVAVMTEDDSKKFFLNRNDVDRKTCRSRGKGGQKVNKTESCVVLTHRPTGIQIRSEDHRNQTQNEAAAWERLESRLAEIHEKGRHQKSNQVRNDQIGGGSRNDKRRTYREQDGFVIDHITGKQITIKDLYKGHIQKLHK